MNKKMMEINEINHKMLITYDIDNQVYLKFENGGLISIVTIDAFVISYHHWEAFYQAVKNNGSYEIKLDQCHIVCDGDEVYFHTPNTYISLSLLKCDRILITTLRKMLDDERFVKVYDIEMD